MPYPAQSLLITQREMFTLSPVDGGGTPVALDAPPVLTSSNTAVATASIDFRGQFWVTAVGVGSSTITVTASSSGVSLSESFDVTVSPDVAVTLGIKFTAPIAK